MTSVNVTTQSNTVTVQQGDATTVTIATQGPQGPAGNDGADGATGAAGTAATIAIGTVTTGAAGSSASVTNSGSSSAATFDFSIPRGATGATGSQGPAGNDGSDATVNATNVASAGAVMDGDFTSNGFMKRTGAGSYTVDTNTYLTAVPSGYLQNMSEDSSPQLGGDLASNGFDIKFADNDKALFGADSDLQIFHNGSFSVIMDNGTGGLALRGENTISMGDTTGNRVYLQAIKNGSVSLRHNNIVRCETTASGITVTGSVTTQDMNMSNLNGIANEVDNTKGSWSIQEGADDLFLINRVSGKKYKFNLTEIS